MLGWSVDERTIVAGVDLGFDISFMFFVIFELNIDFLGEGLTTAIFSFDFLFH